MEELQWRLCEQSHGISICAGGIGIEGCLGLLSLGQGVYCVLEMREKLDVQQTRMFSMLGYTGTICCHGSGCLDSVFQMNIIASSDKYSHSVAFFN